MALVTTAASDSGRLTTYEGSIKPDSGELFGEQLFEGTEAVPAVATTDTATFTLQINLERNYAHRIVQCEISLRGKNSTDLAEWEPGMRWFVSTDKGGFSSVVSFDFELLGQSYQSGTASANKNVSFTFLPLSGALGVTRYFHPVNLPGELLDVSTGGRLFGRLFNASAAATAAIEVTWRVRTQLFTLEQLRHAKIHFPVLITPVA